MGTKYQPQRNTFKEGQLAALSSKELGYKPRALTQRTKVMHTRCHHIILSTSTETADLSLCHCIIEELLVSRLWPWEGWESVTLDPREQTRGTDSSETRTTNGVHPQARDSRQSPRSFNLSDSFWSQWSITYTCDWCVHSTVMWQNSTLKRNPIFSPE